ncbi:MAG TPA: MlaD family protein, partial [Verrucomicrobiae bacterium]|nr:MlaD family protein [Verrucomicrobiae bacterium]
IYLTLLTGDLDSLQEQTPIFYRGVQVGEVTEVRLGRHAQHVIVTARIQQEFAPLVRTNSVFWNAGGIHIHAGLVNGVQISAESAQTVISGGIAFATPDDYGAAATNGDVFLLSDKENDDWKKWNPDIPLPSSPADENTRTSLSDITKK